MFWFNLGAFFYLIFFFNHVAATDEMSKQKLMTKEDSINRHIRMTPCGGDCDDDEDDDDEDDGYNGFHGVDHHHYGHHHYIHDHHMHEHEHEYHHGDDDEDDEDDGHVVLNKEAIVKLLMQKAIDQAQINQAMLRKQQYDQMASDKLRTEMQNRELEHKIIAKKIIDAADNKDSSDENIASSLNKVDTTLDGLGGTNLGIATPNLQTSSGNMGMGGLNTGGLSAFSNSYSNIGGDTSSLTSNGPAIGNEFDTPSFVPSTQHRQRQHDIVQPFFPVSNPLRADYAERALNMIQTGNSDILQRARHVKDMLEQRDVNNEIALKMHAIHEAASPETYPQANAQLGRSTFNNDVLPSHENIGSNPFGMLQGSQLPTFGRQFGMAEDLPLKASPLSTPFENIPDSTSGLVNPMIGSGLAQRTSITASNLEEELQAKDTNMVKALSSTNIDDSTLDSNGDKNNGENKKKKEKKKKKKKAIRKKTKSAIKKVTQKEMRKVYEQLLAIKHHKTKKHGKAKPKITKPKIEVKQAKLKGDKLTKMLEELSHYKTLSAKTVPNDARVDATEEDEISGDNNNFETSNAIDDKQENGKQTEDKEKGKFGKNNGTALNENKCDGPQEKGMTCLFPMDHHNLSVEKQNTTKRLHKGENKTMQLNVEQQDNNITSNNNQNSTTSIENNTINDQNIPANTIVSADMSVADIEKEELEKEKKKELPVNTIISPLSRSLHKNYSFHDALEKIDSLMVKMNKLDKTKYKKEFDLLHHLAARDGDTTDIQILTKNANEILFTLGNILPDERKTQIKIPHGSNKKLKVQVKTEAKKGQGTIQENKTANTLHRNISEGFPLNQKNISNHLNTTIYDKTKSFREKALKAFVMRTKIQDNYRKYKSLLEEVRQESKSVDAIPFTRHNLPTVPPKLVYNQLQTKKNKTTSTLSKMGHENKTSINRAHVTTNEKTWVVNVNDDQKTKRNLVINKGVL